MHRRGMSGRRGLDPGRGRAADPGVADGVPSTVIMEQAGRERGKTVFLERVGELRSLFSRRTCRSGSARPVAAGAGDGVELCADDHRGDAAVAAAAGPAGRHWTLISRWGRVPEALVWDNESAVSQWCGGKQQLTEPMNAFGGTLDPGD